MQTKTESRRTAGLMTIPEAAAYLNVSERWVKRAREERRLDFVKLGNHIRVQRAELDRFLVENIDPRHERDDDDD